MRDAGGDSTSAFDGRAGWLAAPHRPVPVLGLAGADLDGLRIDAELAFPARIAQVAGQWRTGLATVIDDREVQVVQGTGSGGACSRSTSTPRRACSSGRSAPCRRRWAGCRHRWTTPTTARWPA